MRLFIAITLNDEIKNYIKSLQESIKAEGVKLTFAKESHLTLKFLGEVLDNNLNKIKNLLSDIKFKPFFVDLDNLGIFPNENYIRVIWVGLNKKKEIIELQQKIDKVLLADFSKDKKFHPHITLARVKFIENKKEFSNKLKDIKIDKKRFKIENFKLIKSTLTSNGPIYEELAEFSSE